MMLNPPDKITDLADWIVRSATSSDSPELLLDGVCQTLVRHGVPLWHVSVAVPTIDPQFRGAALHWWRDSTIKVETAAHGAETDEKLRHSPVFALQSQGVLFGRWMIEHDEGCEVHPILKGLRSQGGTEYAMFLVDFSPATSVSGTAISIATDRAGGFRDHDLERFREIVPALGVAIYRQILLITATQSLDSYLGRMTGAKVLAGEIVRGQGEIIEAAIVLADLSGFTTVTDREDAMDIVRWLNEHLEAIGDPVIENGGEILKFLGDGLLAVFPAMSRTGSRCEACEAAFSTAMEALRRNDAVNARRKQAGEPQLVLDVALHFGEVVYGNVGTSRRLDFTVIGRAVNEVSRIEKLCDELGLHVLISDEFAKRCSQRLTNLGAFTLRGVGSPRVLFTPE
ncbi:adenylate/guanylate cyclase domain-containing protein [Bradyrhizobium centrolobii]|nr:adenylate/guanylate cyclase domain-containing protein [Bradyrhizobium centrolobii]